MVTTISVVPGIIRRHKYVGDLHWLANDLDPSKKKFIGSAPVIHPMVEEIEIEKKHLNKCASVMVNDWLYFKEEKEIKEEKSKRKKLQNKNELQNRKKLEKRKKSKIKGKLNKRTKLKKKGK
ncbi:hypothetical protein BDD12DRAFT_805242 [Trichophaea hybrida]|nr:hypothetical protein BDD12DRAFT_805242 [Trichophaea hybrida]